jgi:hypothetical protein
MPGRQWSGGYLARIDTHTNAASPHRFLRLADGALAKVEDAGGKNRIGTPFEDGIG